MSPGWKEAAVGSLDWRLWAWHSYDAVYGVAGWQYVFCGSFKYTGSRRLRALWLRSNGNHAGCGWYICVTCRSHIQVGGKAVRTSLLA